MRSLGSVGSILRIDAFRGAPGEQDLSVADGAEEPAARRDGFVHRVDAAHTKPEPGKDLLELERHARRGEQVSISAGVDDDVGEHGEATRLALEGDSREPVAVA